MDYDRLTGLDASFLHLESEAQPMHVGSLATFEGPPFFDAAGRALSTATGPSAS